MIIVRWKLGTGATGEAEIAPGQKWTFGRSGGDEEPTIVSDDPSVSRNALTIRDSGPGPIAFRGQRGTKIRVELIHADGSRELIDEGTAVNLVEDAHRVELTKDGESILEVFVDFDRRMSVRERQEQGDSL